MSTAPNPNDVNSDTPIPYVLTEAARTEARLVQAVVGGARIYVECPEWCVKDHAATKLVFIEDLSHEGARIALTVPMYGSHTEQTLITYMMQWPFTDEPEVRLALEPTDSDDAALLPASAALAVADQVVAHGEAIRGMALALQAFLDGAEQ